MKSLKEEKKRKFRMFKKRVKPLDVHEESQRRHQRIWNLEDNEN